MRAAVFLAVLLAVTACSDRAVPDEGFAGTWVLTLEGHPVLVLTLHADGARFAGTFARPVRMTSDGRSFSRLGSEVTTVPVTTDPPRDRTLRFQVTSESDPNDKTAFEMKLSAAEAELKIVDAPFPAMPLSRYVGSTPAQVWTGWDERRSYMVDEPDVEPNAEMAAIYRADQAVRQSMQSFQANAKQIEKEDAVRRQQTRALIDKGALRAAEDFRLAALVFQHGSEPRDFLYAHTLALVALAKGDRTASWIAAASLDRYLLSIKQPQIFGNQFDFEGRLQGPLDRELVSDPLRRALGVPALADQEALAKSILTSRP